MDPREELGYKIAHHDIESLKEAMKKGCDLNYRDRDGDTYLHIDNKLRFSNHQIIG